MYPYLCHIRKESKVITLLMVGLEESQEDLSNFVYSLNFWCLNPGVAFGDLGIMTKSIILTSGTLSPMGSFESELNVKFEIKYEANHVINREQVWVGTVSKGPTNHVLNATYKHSETLAFQDELGRMLLSVCETIPRGVLCFLPSYAMLDKLVDR
ncbi:Fanconi anemia group J protein-like [Armadillidium vulgare]|nr:Fanconi anemia group J protein-like [Armadillidium vulgare]